MNVHFSCDAPSPIVDSGMARFLNPINLERYRKLATAGTDAPERDRLLKLLATERASFIRDCQASPLKEVASKAGHGMTSYSDETPGYAMR